MLQELCEKWADLPLVAKFYIIQGVAFGSIMAISDFKLNCLPGIQHLSAADTNVISKGIMLCTGVTGGAISSFAYGILTGLAWPIVGLNVRDLPLK